MKPQLDEVGPFEAFQPWMGPVIMPGGPNYESLTLSMGSDPKLLTPVAVTWIPVYVDKSLPRWRWRIDYEAVDEIKRSYPNSKDSLFFERIKGVGQPRAGVEEPGTDWMTWFAPEWIVQHKARDVAVLIVYPRAVSEGQSVLDGEGVFKAVSEAIGTMRVGKNPLGIVTTSYLPRRSSGMLRLALGSCLYPRGILDQIPAEKAWQRLNKRYYRRGKQRLDLLVLTGDQVYLDATAGLFDPTQGDDRYRNPYLAWLNEDRVRSAMRRTLSVTLPDDHEIDDNWEPIPRLPDMDAYNKNQTLWEEGVRSFLRYQRPAPYGARGTGTRPLRPERERFQPIGFQFKLCGVPIFMLDTRTRREHRSSESLAEASLLRSQWARLKAWLMDDGNKNCPKLIVSPAAVLPRHRHSARTIVDGGEYAALRSDGWDGYPCSLTELLGFIVDHEVQQVVFLSGDEHLGLMCSARLRSESTQKEATIYSIHSPGLYSPFPFANARASNFILNERFEFSRGTTPASSYTVDVATRVVRGNGFVFVSLENKNGAWQLHAEFDVDPRDTAQNEIREFSIPLS